MRSFAINLETSFTGRDILLWEATTRDSEHQMLRIVVWTADLDAGGNVVHRRYRRINLSWMTPEQSFNLLEEAGFEIDAAYGDFDEKVPTTSDG